MNRHMKTYPLLLVCSLALQSFAADTSAPALASLGSGTNKLAPLVVLAPTEAALTAPLVLTNGCIGQPEQTELPAGGKAIYNFTLANAGTFVIRAVVNAPDESANSFYVNIDANPEDPAMIWDIDTTSGFEERTVSWRGNGDPTSDEFAPKRFKLSAGAHKLIIVGREPAQMKTVFVYPAEK